MAAPMASGDEITDDLDRMLSAITSLLQPVCSENCVGSESGFLSAVAIWINKPHVVNRRLCGSKFELVTVVTVLNAFPDWLLVKRTFSDLDLVCDFETFFNNKNESLMDKPQEDGSFPFIGANDRHEHEAVEDIRDCIDAIPNDAFLVIVRQMLQKQPEKHENIAELIIIDRKTCQCTFIPLRKQGSGEYHDVAYSFKYAANPKPCLTLYASTNDCTLDSKRKLSVTWIQNQLLQKIARWSEQPSLRTQVTSLCLLNIEEYNRLYSELKKTYGLYFAKIWPETTNPEKFVYEDVAIATYLLCLWRGETERSGLPRKQRFVDLGCGNGLLVHILNSEGHPGYGIDLRRRNIWDLYGPGTDLREASITPSNECVFPDVDWLIGNHSDELTPWIPVMAARSSYNCKYFVLPCCFWDFITRFSFDKSSSKGVDSSGKYRQYLNYIRDIGETCGFRTEEDILRIPSTKRVCFVGRSRSYSSLEEEQMDASRLDFLSCKQTLVTQQKDEPMIQDQDKTAADSEGQWTADFTPRSKVETTRNCVAISQEIKTLVVMTVFNKILGCDNSGCDITHSFVTANVMCDTSPNVCDVGKTCGKGESCIEKVSKMNSNTYKNADQSKGNLVYGSKFAKLLKDENCVQGRTDSKVECGWRKGGRLTLGQVADLFDKPLLHQLKNECGGLQTLLRNHSHIFQVSGGHVCLRDFTLDNPFEGRYMKGRYTDKTDYVKTTLCWFYDHHPDGCPRSSDKCAYAHGIQELRTKPRKEKS
ncbi:probable tRNA (uracil-O(2)-)-methyltransferase isoform X1 [Dreissena polymorpha]|uniref:probable tRNA (uracil-O(2)-)-methyltransferase isoform X1 n=2 Tax=Dreissena polymorpha TaxID=45954 RepID=UPI0022646109|nr:probable tRNA (uracil-O(2)-)-methyltransferase isoform X1 [Dreissena polymorpha]